MAIISPITRTLRDGTRLVVRSADEADAPGLIALNERMTRTSPHMLRDLEEQDRDPAEFCRVMLAHNVHPGKAFLVAVVGAGGECAGRLAVRCGQWRRLAHRAEFGISVDQPWRGRGVGSALISTMLDWAAAHPTIEKVCLSCFATNVGARRLYERLGFIEEAVFPKHIRQGPGQYVDDVQMAIWVKAGIAPEGHTTWTVAPSASDGPM
ncbi:MAG: GNAT family N-acetyltransferase [Phycisphaerales bacterium]|nr:GNAT family N-acetyltransferase [Phycisphaerales bacterium]